MIYSSKAKIVNPDIDNEQIDIFDVEFRTELNLYGYILNLFLAIVYLVAFLISSKILVDYQIKKEQFLDNEIHLIINLFLASLFMGPFHAYVLFKKDLEKTKLNSGFFVRILKAWPSILGTFFFSLLIFQILSKNDLLSLPTKFGIISLLWSTSMFMCVVNVWKTQFESWSNIFKPWIIKEKNSAKFHEDLVLNFNLFAFIFDFIILLAFGFALLVILYIKSGYIQNNYSNNDTQDVYFDVFNSYLCIELIILIGALLKDLCYLKPNPDQSGIISRLMKCWPVTIVSIIFALILLLIHSNQPNPFDQQIYVFISGYIMSIYVPICLSTSNTTESLLRFLKPWYFTKKSDSDLNSDFVESLKV